MLGFVAKYTNRLDTKGRVSIPAQFRAVLAKDGFEGLYCFPANDVIDAGGNEFVEEVTKHLEEYPRMTTEHDKMSTAWLTELKWLKIDRDGRISLPEDLIEYAEITDEVTFAGHGFKFQMWNPEKFKVFSEEARKYAEAVRSGSVSPRKTQEEAK